MQETRKKNKVVSESVEYIGSISRGRLQMQDLFLRGTKLKCADVVESTRHVTTLSNQVPETI